MSMAKDSAEVVLNAAKHDGRAQHAGVTWERSTPSGFIHVYSGAWCWRWYVKLADGRDAISPSVYPGPALAMERGQVAHDALLAGTALPVDWTG